MVAVVAFAVVVLLLRMAVRMRCFPRSQKRDLGYPVLEDRDFYD
jgi:hypothetical protein